MIILAWAADFALFLIVLIVAGLTAALPVCLVVWGATAAWRRFARPRRDRESGAFVADGLKASPEPPPANEEAAGFAAYLLGTTGRDGGGT